MVDGICIAVRPLAPARRIAGRHGRSPCLLDRIEGDDKKFVGANGGKRGRCFVVNGKGPHYSGAEGDLGPVGNRDARDSSGWDGAGRGIPDLDKKLTLDGGAVAAPLGTGAAFTDLCDIGNEIATRGFTPGRSRGARFRRDIIDDATGQSSEVECLIGVATRERGIALFEFRKVPVDDGCDFFRPFIRGFSPVWIGGQIVEIVFWESSLG